MERYLTELGRRRRGWEIPAGIALALLPVAEIQVWLEDSPADENFLIWLLAHTFVMALTLMPLRALLLRALRRRRARTVAKRLAALPGKAVDSADMDRVLGIKDSWSKVQDLLRRGYLRNLALEDGRLVIDGGGEEAPAEDVRAEEGETDDILGKIRRLNDDIADENVSRRIDQLEQATAGILETIRQRPERAGEARRFMNYYLPTTLKLLESYRLMEGQSYQGGNIAQSRRSIEEVLDKLVVAAREQQDRLFGTEALNVEAEISALETMLASDGLTKK